MRSIINTRLHAVPLIRNHQLIIKLTALLQFDLLLKLLLLLFHQCYLHFQILSRLNFIFNLRNNAKIVLLDGLRRHRWCDGALWLIESLILGLIVVKVDLILSVLIVFKTPRVVADLVDFFHSLRRFCFFFHEFWVFSDLVLFVRAFGNPRNLSLCIFIHFLLLILEEPLQLLLRQGRHLALGRHAPIHTAAKTASMTSDIKGG